MNQNHAEVVCEFGRQVAEFAENGFTLVSDYRPGAGRFFFVLKQDVGSPWAAGAETFSCTSIEELKSWLSGYRQSLKLQGKA